MSNTIFIVRDPSGKVRGASHRSEDDALSDAWYAWEADGFMRDDPTIEHGYTCEAITLPSPHDAAIVAAATAFFDAHDALNTADPWTMAMLHDKGNKHAALEDAVRAKREATDA